LSRFTALVITFFCWILSIPDCTVVAGTIYRRENELL